MLAGIVGLSPLSSLGTYLQGLMGLASLDDCANSLCVVFVCASGLHRRNDLRLFLFCAGLAALDVRRQRLYLSRHGMVFSPGKRRSQFVLTLPTLAGKQVRA